MKLQELSERLISTSEIINKFIDKFNDKKTIDETDKFIKALMRFERTLQIITVGNSATVKELKTLLLQQFQASQLDNLGDFSKKVLGKKTTYSKKMDYHEYVNKVALDIVEKGKADLAITLLKRLKDNEKVDLNSLDKESILIEVRRLGSLTEQELEIERQLLINDRDRLILYAKTAGVKLKSTSKAESIFKNLIALAKRYNENTGITPFGYEIIK